MRGLPEPLDRNRKGKSMRRVDAFLTRMAQAVWPAALVYCETMPGKETWYVEKTGPSEGGFSPEQLGIGSTFSEARAALTVMVKAESARTGVAFPAPTAGEDVGDDLILSTQKRLMEDALRDGIYEDLAEKMRTQTQAKANHYLLKRTAKDNAHAAILAVLDDLVQARIALRSTTAIFRKVMGILYKWLPEEGQRQAKRELDALTVKDIHKATL